MNHKDRENAALSIEQPEAGSHSRDISAASVAEARWGGSLPPLSGGELAWALRRAGFEARLDGPEHVVVTRRHSFRARIPLREQLHAGMVNAILATVGVTPKQLLEYLVQPEHE